eukprot:TRINITY_DN59729_c2_g1_i1.p2 TRINITY_DN59729_c2_g1~~TRINITY_DN59729_c2_g1_i1.p2  ORF type:complete len:167 (-),score=80.75 TRINITY_DN59729_c2_g1_i1:58-558(-)
MSQIAIKSTSDDTQSFTWNYPIDITFRSTNVHGWPQLVISCYGINMLGKDVIRGYGAVHLPTTPGRHTRYIRLYRPRSSSMCQRLRAWITATPPEFLDSKFFAYSDGREVTRVQSNGVVKVTFNITTKNMTEFGYQVSSEVNHADDVVLQDEKQSKVTQKFQLTKF